MVGDLTTLTLDKKSRKALDNLRKRLGARSNAEVIRRALTLLKLASETIEKDGQFILRDRKGFEREVIMG